MPQPGQCSVRQAVAQPSAVRRKAAKKLAARGGKRASIRPGLHKEETPAGEQGFRSRRGRVFLESPWMGGAIGSVDTKTEGSF